MRIVAEIRVCGDCLQFIANGPDELTPDVAAACAAGVQREGGHVVPACPEDCEGGFSWSPCQLCLSPLGGDRHPATVLEPEPRFLAVLIDPQGVESFDAYGPMTKDRAKATRFVSEAVAHKAANRRFGRTGEGFWRSEREAESSALREYRGWTHRVEGAGL